MKRTKINNTPDFIITADIHRTDHTPIARTDDYMEAQNNKLRFLREAQQKYNCPVLDAGDLFNHWKPSPALLTSTMKNLPDKFITIPGNHDLPEHSLDLFGKSGLATLHEAEKIEVLRISEKWTMWRDKNDSEFVIFGLPYGHYDIKTEPPISPTIHRYILILHELVWKYNPPFPGAEGFQAKQVLEDHPDFDLIITGHHHTAFTEEVDGRLLVNPGPMMRNAIDKVNYKPRFYLYYAKNNTVEPVYYPIADDVFNLAITQQQAEKEEKIQAFIEKMDLSWEIELSFEANIEAFMNKNKTPRKLRELIWKYVR